MKKDKDLYYVGYPSTEGVYVCVVSDKQQISTVVVNTENLKDWDKTDFANGELLGCSMNDQQWYLCVFQDKHEAMNAYAMFQQAYKAERIKLGKNIKVQSVNETLSSLGENLF